LFNRSAMPIGVRREVTTTSYPKLATSRPASVLDNAVRAVMTSHQSTATLSRTIKQNVLLFRSGRRISRTPSHVFQSTRLHTLSQTSMLMTTPHNRKQKPTRFQHRPFGRVGLAPLLSPNGAISSTMLTAPSLSTSRRRSIV